MIAHRLRYRLRQFADAFGEDVPESDRTAALASLPPALQSLFLQMSPPLQRHHLAVYRDLTASGIASPDLCAAALLHDVGKGRVHPFERALYVALATVHPKLPQWLARVRWFSETGLSRIATHPERGAAMVAAAGGSERLVHLVRRHQDRRTSDPELQLLQRVDDRH